MKTNECNGCNEDERKIIARIFEAVKSISFGYVHIVVQDSKVVQIDKTEKIRLDGKAGAKPQGGD